MNILGFKSGSADKNGVCGFFPFTIENPTPVIEKKMPTIEKPTPIIGKWISFTEFGDVRKKVFLELCGSEKWSEVRSLVSEYFGITITAVSFTKEGKTFTSINDGDVIDSIFEDYQNIEVNKPKSKP